MKADLWKWAFNKTACPPWQCPTCKKGIVKLDQNSLVFKETVASKREHKREGWDPTDVKHAFTAWGLCSNPACKQDFVMAGTGGVEPEFKGDGEEWEWGEFFFPKICLPMPDMIEIPTACPESVKAELCAAFRLFWSHPGACAGRIRVALECLLDHLGIPARKKDANGKYRDLYLHARIELFARKEPLIASEMMALKWLGNTGSHNGQISKTMC